MKYTGRSVKAQNYIERVKQNYFNIDESNLKILIDFDNENQANDLSINSRHGYLYHLIKFSKFIGDKKYKEVTKNDIQEYLNKLNGDYSPKTLFIIKITIKKFYSWHYGLKKGNYPEQVDWVTTQIRERHKKLDKKILTEEEYKKLLKGCLSQRDRAFISFLYNTGARVSEALNTEIGDLNFDKKGRYVSVKLDGKTGEREVSLISGIAEIQALLKQHPKEKDKSARLFYGRPTQNAEYIPVGFEGIYSMLQEVSFRVLKRRISAHLFRHTFASNLALKGYNESKMRVIMGWSKSSNMPSHYTWLTDKKVNEERLQEAGLEVKDLEKARKEAVEDVSCPRCKVMNTFDSDYCINCFFALSSKGIEKSKDEDKLVFNKLSIDQKEELFNELIKRFKNDLLKEKK